ncbi:MAG: ribosomal RNA small subunit methyltransferase A [Omnitrophica WOR_2 bacterium RIFCSPHIGHO2_02_FULL_45_21]|nr:MAG: ribosomal RNA small subunit methyltransferase A [Omnitrophica WOR_2 bacterium RIFCSPHIGHO2_02_FULL_45_21]
MHQKPKKSLGQNFLTDKNIQEKIVQACKLKKTDIILEIGSGRGELTQHLLKVAKRVIAVEVDKELCELLTSKFSLSSNFELVNKDILKTNLVNLIGCQGSGRIRVIANIPYYISTPIIAYLLDYNQSIEVIYLTLQKELALRLTAGPGNKSYGALSCFAQFYTHPKILFSIKGSSFWPRPKVDSCFVELKMLPKPKVKVKNETFFFKLIRLAFNQRRKLLKNSLARLFPQVKIADCLKAIALKQKIRAEELALSDFAKVADYFADKHIPD